MNIPMIAPSNSVLRGGLTPEMSMVDQFACEAPVPQTQQAAASGCDQQISARNPGRPGRLWEFRAQTGFHGILDGIELNQQKWGLNF